MTTWASEIEQFPPYCWFGFCVGSVRVTRYCTPNPREAKAAATSCAGSDGHSRLSTLLLTSATRTRLFNSRHAGRLRAAPGQQGKAEREAEPTGAIFDTVHMADGQWRTDPSQICVGATYGRSVLPAAVRLCSGVRSTQIYVLIHTVQCSLTCNTVTPPYTFNSSW